MYEHHVLGVSESATLKEIKARFKILAKQYHPDISKEPNAEAKFKEVNDAYQTLLKLGDVKTVEEPSPAPPPPPKPSPSNVKEDGFVWKQSAGPSAVKTVYRHLLGNDDTFFVAYPDPVILANTRICFMHHLDEFSIFVDSDKVLPFDMVAKTHIGHFLIKLYHRPEWI